MIEAYAFLAMFPVQILAMSVVYPAWFVRYSRRQATTIPAERLAQLYPGVDLNLARESFLTRYRRLNMGIVVIGLLLLGWLFTYLQQPDWDEGPVEALVTVYFLLQAVVPLGVLVWHGVSFNRAHKRRVTEAKRTANLQRRGLFDFISPFAVVVAGVGYLLFAGFVIYLQRHSLLGFASLITLGCITMVYALNAFVVYLMLYGKRPNPSETHAARLHTIGLVVKSSVYSCIVCVVFLSLNLTLVLLDLRAWAPFALSSFFALTALLSIMGMTPRKPGADEPDSEGRVAIGRAP